MIELDTYQSSDKFMSKAAGMSMIELMIVVTIIGLLAIMVFPSYQQHILKSRLNNVSYAKAKELSLPKNEYYNFSVVNVGATTYTLVAQAKSSQKEDGACQTLALDQSMNKTPAACW